MATPSAKKGKKTKSMGLEVGDTGTEILGGIVNEEYNTKLRDTQGIKIYDEMRKSDGTVAAALLAITLPIRRAKWYIEAADDSQEADQMREFVEKAFFEWQTITWNNFLRQALLSLPFGVMPFEKVFEVRHHEGRDYITWRKFAPRLPKSIDKWQLSDGSDGIVQRKQNGDLAEIPMDKLCIFIHDMEGENWWGTSVLRPAYKHWYIKNQFYKIDAIAFERQGLGVPYCKLPENATEADRKKARELLQNLRAHHQAYIIEPHDYEIGFKDMMAKTLRDPEHSIAHHNREIVKSVLAQFLELGATDSGSRALSQDQTELFLMALGAIAGNFADVLNRYAIPQLIDFNFDGVENYPKLKWTGIDRVDAEKLSNAYDKLSTAGGIKADLKTDEQFLREVLGLPQREYQEGDDDDSEKEPKEDIEEDDKDPEEEDEEELEAVGMSEFSDSIKKKVYPERSVITEKVKASIIDMAPADAITRIKSQIATITCRESDRHQQFYGALKAELTKELAHQRKHSFADDFKSPLPDFRRPLTFAEKKVNFAALQSELDRLEEDFKREVSEVLEAERAKYVSKINAALAKGDTIAVKSISMQAKKAYEAIIYRYMKDSYQYGKNNAALELGIKAPANDKEVLARISLQASAIAEQHLADITGESKVKITEALTKGESSVQALAIADAAIAAKIVELARNTSEIIMAGYVNHGRNTAITAATEKVYALQRSEILDNRTCNYCLSVDGRIVEKTDPFAKNTIFHSGCRGIWVAILLDEEELPPIGGIPKSLRDRFGDAVNDLIQPKTPQSQSQLARKEVERRAKRNQKKAE